MTQETEPVGWTIEANKSLAIKDSMALANQIFTDAGWTPIPKPCWAGGFVMERQVGGQTPDGAEQHVKGLDIVPPGHPEYGPDTPDEHHEAAAWLVARYVAKPPEASETPQDETHGETGEEQADSEASEAVLGGFAEGQDGSTFEADVSGGEGAFDGEVSDAHSVSPDLPIDADFTLDTIELIEPSEPDFGRELLEFEGELAGEPERAADASGAFIFGDNLHQMRTAAIGLVSTHAAILTAEIEAASGEQEGEYADLQSFVVTNLDKHTGAFTLQDAPSLMRCHRWSELDAMRAAVRTIDRVRKEKTAFLLSAERAEVEAFDPSEGWP